MAGTFPLGWLMDYNDELDLKEANAFPPERLREIAARVREAIKQQKEGPLPSWIKAPKPRFKPMEENRVSRK
jgi:hypothetical protein